MKLLLIMPLCCFTYLLHAQTSLYNGRPIPLYIDSNQSNYKRVDTVGTEIVQWFVFRKDTFGKVYTYYATDYQQVQTVSLVHYTSNTAGGLKAKDNWEYFGIQAHYRKTGEPEYICHYENGKRNGICTLYHKNGSVSEKGLYHEGKPIGEWRYYNEKSELINIKEF
jgi:hypothetical protein